MRRAASLIFFCCSLAAWVDEKPAHEAKTKVKTCFPPEFADANHNNFYARFFKVMEEEPIYPLTSDKKCKLYRFTYTPSFHSPVIVTLAVEEESAKLYVKKGRNVSDELLLTMRVSKLAKNSWMRISRGAVSNFEALLDQSNFWKLPPQRKDIAEGLDGAGWLLEAIKEGKYHVTFRWSPLSQMDSAGAAGQKLDPLVVSREDCLTMACVYLLTLAEEVDEPIY